MILFIQAILLMVNFKVKAKYNTKMDNIIKASSNKVNFMDKVHINM